MSTRDYIDIVIPVYNEGENIRSLLEAFEIYVRFPIRVLICYDTDDDTTLPIVKNYQGKLEIISVKNQGHFAHGAVITGFNYSDAPAIISYMADDDYNAKVINEMIELYRQGNEVVCASRFMKGGSMIGCPWPKSFIVRVVSFSLYFLGRLPSHDATNAFRLFSRQLLSKVKIESIEGFAYSLELLAKCHRLGLGIAETPANWFERIHGRSRFQILPWARAYLRWFFYIFATTYLHHKKL